VRQFPSSGGAQPRVDPVAAATKLSEADVVAELERIVAHPLFQSSRQLSAFLKFVVTQTLAGRSDELKEYVIGVEVLNRSVGYNPRDDPASRIVAGRLRSKLAEYYQESGRNDPVIITLPRGGYVPVFESNPLVTPGVDQTSERRSLLSSRAIIGIVVIACLTPFIALVLSSRSASRGGLSPVPLTSYPGEEMQPSFSPDGKRVAFSWNGVNQDNFDIYIKDIESDQPVRLTTNSSRDFSPAWSPDGRKIAFGRLVNPSGSEIYVVSMSGGPERKLAESTAPAGFRPRPFVAWSPDGKWLAFSDIDSQDTTGPTGSISVSLFLLSLETGERRRLTSFPPNSVGDAAPAFAPDGHALAFVRTQTIAISNLYLLPLDPDLKPRGPAQPVTAWNRFVTSPSWSRDKKEIVFAAGVWDGLGLWRWLESGGAEPDRLDFLARNASDPTFSRQGDLAYSQKSTDTNVWRVGLTSPDRSAGVPAKLIASTMIDVNPQFSPDGKRIVFPSDRSGTREIWASDSDGANPRQLTSMGAPITGCPRWSPDGSRIVFDSNKEGQFELYVVSASGGPAERLTNHPADDALATFSQDGRSIYFMSSRSGRREVWKMAANGRETAQLTKHGGVVPFPSPDDKFLYYSERAGEGERNGLGGLRRLNLLDGKDDQILPSVTYLNAAVVREGVYFIPRADSNGRYFIQFLDFKTAKIATLVPLSGAVSEGLAISPDGRTLLYSQIDERRSDLMMIRGFR
jgi:Tol biopolymer transport system component